MAKTVAKKEKTAEVQSITQLRKDLSNKRMELRMGKLKDVRSISKIQDKIARILTAQRAKELETV